LNFLTPKGTTLSRTTSCDVLNAKIGPTGLWGLGRTETKCSKHSKILGNFAHAGGKNPLAD